MCSRLLPIGPHFISGCGPFFLCWVCESEVGEKKKTKLLAVSSGGGGMRLRAVTAFFRQGVVKIADELAQDLVCVKGERRLLEDFAERLRAGGNDRAPTFRRGQ